MIKSVWKLLLFSLFAGLVACSDGDKEAGGGVTEDQGFAIVDKAIAGVSQKGPFVVGSKIRLYGFDEDFKQKGSVFNSTIDGEKGDFVFKNVNLEYPYAWLEVDGYYYNEVTGKKSAGTITLNAITDLSGREKANVNLLTHLEYGLVMKLASQGMPMDKAKHLAEQEIFAAFDIEGDFEKFEDMNILQSGESDAVLLAISVLLQRNLGEAEFTEQITKISGSLETEGMWEDDFMKAEIADWAESADLAAIRENVESWKMSDSIPAFENYVNQFWWNNYGLGPCGSEQSGKSKRTQNAKSVNADAIYKCDGSQWLKQ